MTLYTVTAMIQADSDDEALTRAKGLNIDTSKGEWLQSIHANYAVAIPHEMMSDVEAKADDVMLHPPLEE